MKTERKLKIMKNNEVKSFVHPTIISTKDITGKKVKTIAFLQKRSHTYVVLLRKRYRT